MEQHVDARRRPAVWVALAALYLIWGSTYLGIEVAMRTLPPLLMLSLRFLVAGAVLWLLVGRGQRPTLRHWRAAAVIGAALLLFGNGGVALAQETIDTGTVALIVGSVPLWLALLDRVFLGQRLARAAVAGLVVGFGGVTFLAGGVGGGSLGGAALVLVASLAWAAGSLYARRAAAPRRPLAGAALQMLAGGVLLGLAGLARGEAGQVDPAAVSGESVAALVYLIAFGSLVGFSAYVWLLRNAPMALVGTYAYVNPVVAVALGTLVLGEPLDARVLLGGGAILAAVILIVSARPIDAPAARTGAVAPARAR
ncbi:MAG TPA: EamA family transporter [Gaiellaceae bacterium]|nr:EamA family transporter [Gaiellaceae bacterium]